MHIPRTDSQLLSDFSVRDDQAAFSEFVNRRFTLVYSVALRALNGDHHLAQDVALQVFTDSARTARWLANHASIAGWLFTSARFAAARLARKRVRERARATTAAAMDELSEDTGVDRQELQPLLDAAIGRLPARDQRAVLLRFYAQLDYNAVGTELGVSANTARMRVERGLQKLQAILARRGVTSSAVALAATLETHALVSAPLGLSASVSAAALTASAGTTVAIASLLAAAKWPVTATIAIIAGGAILQSSVTPRHDDVETGAKAEPPALAVSPSSQPDASPGLQPTAQRDAIERAYAALDKDAGLLAERLAQINTQAASDPARSRAESALKIYEINELDTKPSAKLMQSPTYPEALKGAQIPGEALLSITIDSSGEISDAEVIAASHPEFAISALEAVLKSQFNPGHIANQPVASRARLPIKFSPTKEKANPDVWF